MTEEDLYIYQLLVKQHYSQVTPAEKAEIDHFLVENETARNWAKEISEIPREEAQSYIKNLDINAALFQVLEKDEAQSRKRSHRQILWITSTAAIFVLAIGIWFLKNPSSAPTKQVILKENQAATLQLADGRTIEMNDSGQQIFNTGIANVNNTNRILHFTPTLSNGRPASNGWNTLTVPVKLDYQVILHDGTIVWLNSRSKFRFPFTFNGKTREVHLDEGEAYFKVTHNIDIPFIVHTANGDVQVLGTEFNINNYSNQVTTSLVTGKVAISAGDNRQILMPGKEAIIKADKGIVLQDFDPVRQLAWRKGIHYFIGDSITEVSAILQRWFDTKVIIDNPTLSAIKFQASINRNQPLQAFLDQMNLTGIMTFYWKGSELHCK